MSRAALESQSQQQSMVATEIDDELQSENEIHSLAVHAHDSMASNYGRKGTQRSSSQRAPSHNYSDGEFVEDPGPVTAGVLYLWFRRCTRKFNAGITVIKVLPNGKIVRRQLFIGAKPEYLELTSVKLFDIAYYLGDIEFVAQGIHSADFGALLIQDDVRRPKPSKCLVIKLSEATISLIFKSESDRRDAEFLLRVQKRAVVERYTYLRELFEARQKEAGIGVRGR